MQVACAIPIPEGQTRKPLRWWHFERRRRDSRVGDRAGRVTKTVPIGDFDNVSNTPERVPMKRADYSTKVTLLMSESVVMPW
jgi:hypothetical protein